MQQKRICQVIKNSLIKLGAIHSGYKRTLLQIHINDKKQSHHSSPSCGY